MKSKEIVEMTTDEIRERVQTQRAALTKMKMNHVVSPMENPNLIKEARKDIARMETELRKRELSAK